MDTLHSSGCSGLISDLQRADLEFVLGSNDVLCAIGEKHHDLISLTKVGMNRKPTAVFGDTSLMIEGRNVTLIFKEVPDYARGNLVRFLDWIRTTKYADLLAESPGDNPQQKTQGS